MLGAVRLGRPIVPESSDRADSLARSGDVTLIGEQHASGLNASRQAGS